MSGLMHDNVVGSKIHHQASSVRKLFSATSQMQFSRGYFFFFFFFSSLLFWEFVHGKICKFTLRMRGFVVKLASLTLKCIRTILKACHMLQFAILQWSACHCRNFVISSTTEGCSYFKTVLISRPIKRS